MINESISMTESCDSNVIEKTRMSGRNVTMSRDEFRELIACSINVEQTRVVQIYYCDRMGAIF